MSGGIPWGVVLLSLLPLAFFSLTAFVKIGTVLQIVRSALGVQGVPSGAVVLMLSVLLTLLAMAPIGSNIAERFGPLEGDWAKPSSELVQRAEAAVLEPLGDFMWQHSLPRERERFLKLARQRGMPGAEERSFCVVAPAFITSELLAAFSLGVALYLPFLVVDLLVANLLVGFGLMALSPLQVSIPLKLLLFVALGGWGLLAETLVSGYG